MIWPVSLTRPPSFRSSPPNAPPPPPAPPLDHGRGVSWRDDLARLADQASLFEVIPSNCSPAAPPPPGAQQLLHGLAHGLELLPQSCVRHLGAERRNVLIALVAHGSSSMGSSATCTLVTCGGR